MIVIVDYGMGNLASIKNMLKKVGADARISADAREVAAASKLVLPGVGAFDAGMSNLETRGLRTVLDDLVLGRHVPVLGICLGMQLLGKSSEEGELPGLGWIQATTIRFRFEGGDRTLRVPHMGWNVVNPAARPGLFDGLHDAPRFYFVHSYHMVCSDPSDVLATASYGFQFNAAIERGNVAGVQFHPEKSHRFGMELLRNFAEAQC